MFEKLYSILRKSFFLRKTLGPIYRKYEQLKLSRFHEKERANFNRNALEAMRAFDKCMSQNGRRYCLATGTLLGAIRDGGFIPHDEDIDTFMSIKDYSPEIIDELAKDGIRLRRSFSIEDGKFGKEDSFVYKGVQIDIFYVYPEGEGISYFTDYVSFQDCVSSKVSIKKHGGLLPRKILMPQIIGIKRIPFMNLLLPVPVNSDEILKSRYGDSYMIPNPAWSPFENNPNVQTWSEKVGKYVEY